jgi:GTP-binding protein
MKIRNAQFVKSSTSLAQCPEHRKPEFAFIGRSNVGKSSLINMLCENKSLAKTSSKPGKTQTINHFIVDDLWYLVDLPGYGWSAVSKKQKAAWGKMIESYLLQRDQLACLFILLDARLGPQEIDYDFIRWLGHNRIPFVLVFTKTDKITQRILQKNHRQHLEKLALHWEETPHMVFTSAVKLRGRDGLLQIIARAIEAQHDH